MNSNGEIKPKSVQKSRFNLINKRLTKLYGSLKKNTMKTHFKNGAKDKLFTQNPLAKKNKKDVKPKNPKSRTIYASVPRLNIDELYEDEDEEYLPDFETDFQETESLRKFMKTSSVKFGNNKLAIGQFRPYGEKYKQGRIPELVSRNYVDSIPMKQFTDPNNRVNMSRYNTLSDETNRFITPNQCRLTQTTMKNKKKVILMKTDLLSTHFKLGSCRSPKLSESQSNFYKKKSESQDLARIRNKIKHKVEKCSLRVE